MDDYFQARKEGLRVLHAQRQRGADPGLPVLGDLLPEINRMTQISLGLE